MSTKSKNKCKVDSDDSVNLKDILDSFNSTIKEEHTWALCYQCARFFIEALSTNPQSCYMVTDVKELYLRTDGNIHPKTTYLKNDEDQSTRRLITTQQEFVVQLGIVMYSTLDSGEDDEERAISEAFEQLISDMISNHPNRTTHETDDEGIERDSEEGDDQAKPPVHFTLHEIVQRCELHVSTLTKAQAESHYKAVVRAFVTEALELTMFLQTVAMVELSGGGGESSRSRELGKLQFADWSRFWIQVIAELRMGVKLKKVSYSRAPIEYELTPYEIIMKDIKSCRYNLRKIMVNKDGMPPSRVRKDAQEIILEFIRSRPPLKKASDRKLPPRPRYKTPHEQLMTSIRKGRTLRKTTLQMKTPAPPPAAPPDQQLPPSSKRDSKCQLDGESSATSATKRRLITVDRQLIDDDDEEEESPESDSQSEATNNLWMQEEMRIGVNTIDKYDLATPSWRRQTLSYNGLLDPGMGTGAICGSQSVPQSRPDSRQSCTSSETDSIVMPIELVQAFAEHSSNVAAAAAAAAATTTDGGVSSATCAKPLLEQLSLDNRLSLTLEEIVHIRTVLTRAEIEALPVEAHVRANVENRKVCFLCLKTKFGIFGPWGHRCILCKCTVCSKCCSRMNIPMEHFATVPVVLLSPSIMATPEDEEAAAMVIASMGANGGGGSRPSSSNGGMLVPESSGSNSMTASLTSIGSNSGSSTSRKSPSSLDRFRSRASAMGKASSVVDKFREQQMVVCQDCREMVLQIIKSAQANRSAIRNKHLKSLTLDLSPMF